MNVRVRTRKRECANMWISAGELFPWVWVQVRVSFACADANNGGEVRNGTKLKINGKRGGAERAVQTARASECVHDCVQV